MHSDKKHLYRFLEVSILVMGLAVLPAQTLSADSAPARDVSPGLRLAINRTMGRDQAAYHFRESGSGCFETRYAALDADVLVGTRGMTLRTGAGAWTLGASAPALSGNAPALGLPRQTAPNRVEVDRGWAIEWVVNGPSGLEQGWDIPKRPAWATEDGELLIPLEQDGNLRAVAAQADGRVICVRNAQGRDILRYAGLHVTDAAGRELPARFETRPGDGALWIKVTDTGAAYPITIDPWVESAKLFASDRQTNDYLGCSVALSSNGLICAVGAYGSSPGGTNQAGAVYIFTNAAGSWAGVSNETAKLFASDRQENDYLGCSVALSADGRICAAGAYASSPGGTNQAGAVYIFTNAAGSWAGVSNETAKLFASDRQENDYLGCSVALSANGGICAAGTTNAAPGGTNAAGAVYIFTNAAGSWAGVSNETAKLFASDRQENDYLGCSVALSANGGICAAGAYNSYLGEKPFGLGVGAVYIFTNAAGSWAGVSNETAKLFASDGQLSDYFGRSVALNADGGICAAGVPNDAGGPQFVGKVYIFTDAAGSWAGVSNETAKLFASDGQGGDYLGYSVALSADGGICAAGAYGSTTNVGAVYMFTDAAGSWAGVSNETAKFFASDRQTNDYLGYAVALSANGGICAAGAYASSPGGTNDAGAAYVFTNSLPTPNCSVLGINGAAIASGEAASAAKGTDFGSLSWGSVLTNTLSITNSSSTTLSISGVTTNGSSAAYFRISGMPAAVAGGAKSNFNVIYVPGAVGTHTAAVSVANNSTTTSYIVYLAGTCVKQSQTITFSTISDQVVSNIVGLRATASSGLAVSFAVVSGQAVISGNTNLSFTDVGQVSIKASQAGDATYTAAPDVTNTFMVSKATQTITFPAISDQDVTNSLTLSATASSGLAVSFAVGSGPATISGNVATFSATGRVSIIASQAGDANRAAAPNVTNTFNVLPLGIGWLWVTIVPGDVVSAGAQWRVDGGAWQESGTIMTGLSAGAHTVNFSGVTYYDTSADQVVTISPNQITVVQGAYTYAGAHGSYMYVKPICADYDGDKKADPAYFLTMNILKIVIIWEKVVYPSTDNYPATPYAAGGFGPEYNPSDYTPIAADFDGDGKPDLGFYKAATGKWSAMLSTANYTTCDMTPLLGNIFYTGLAADFDGDHKADPAVYNPVTADWQVNFSSNDYQTVTLPNLLGGPGFVAGAADMDGDGFADPYVCNMKTGQCKVLLSRLFYARYETEEGYLGVPGGILALADYDGDGFADPAVLNSANSTLTMRLSGNYYQLSTFNFLSTNNVTASPIQ